MSIISIIGTGGMAAAIGGLAAKAGHNVEVLSRDIEKAQKLAQQLGAGATVQELGAVPSGDIVILAVPYAVVVDVVSQYGKRLSGKVLIDITNPIKSDLTGFLVPADSSGAQELAKLAPATAPIVKAFNTQFSHVLAAYSDTRQPLDVLLAGDNPQAKARVTAFVESLGLRPLDVGRLPMARTLEHVALLSLGLLAHTVKHSNFAIGVSLFG